MKHHKTTVILLEISTRHWLSQLVIRTICRFWIAFSQRESTLIVKWHNASWFFFSSFPFQFFHLEKNKNRKNLRRNETQKQKFQKVSSNLLLTESSVNERKMRQLPIQNASWTIQNALSISNYKHSTLSNSNRKCNFGNQIRLNKQKLRHISNWSIPNDSNRIGFQQKYFSEKQQLLHWNFIFGFFSPLICFSRSFVI